MELTQVLKMPMVTEKSAKAQAGRKYTFLVDLNANKKEVQYAVEKAYGAKVQQVNIVVVVEKTRLAGRGHHITKRHQGRKAIVTLAPKQSIDFNKLKL